MASGYQIDGTDLDDLCEPYVASKAVNIIGQDLSTFSVDGTAITNRYQKANTDYWAKVITLPLFRDGRPITTVAKGCLPTQTKFAEITSPGTYNISRTDTGLTIGSTTYPASHFRNGVVPTYIGVMMCGGGGGAGGWGCDKGDKYGFNVTPGGAGGGGAVVCAILNVNNNQGIDIGTAGAMGANGSSDSRPSTGTYGAPGGDTTLWGYGCVITAGGGTGGNPGAGDTAHAQPVSGGTVTVSGDGSSYDDVYYCEEINGGQSGAPTVGGGEGTAITNFSFTTGADITKSTMFSNSATGNSYSSGDSYRDSWAGGGCSIGSGATNAAAAGYGGGGASGKNNNNGGNGYCAFYY